MYFNRKNAEQKNWRMIKKGKQFLFGCSLVFAIGAALVAPSVKADTVEANPEAGSTTEEIKSVVAGENVTYAAPAVEVAPSTPVAPAAVAEEKVETTQNSKEEPVVATEKAKEADSIQAPEVTVVYNPSALTDEEKAKVVAAVKAANSKATDVQVQADGSVVVTFADGSTASLSAAQTIKDGSQVAKPRRARAAVAAPVITSNLDGKGSSATDVTVQAPAGSTVKLYNTDGVVIGEAVANAQGVATVTPTNSLPVGEITATATPAGGSESPKSAPVTATRPTLTTVEGGVSRGNDSHNTQLLVTKSHITVYPGESVKIGVTAVSKEMETFWVPNNPTAVKGLKPTGVYLETAGTETYTRRNNGYGGTVAWDQPAGDTVVTFAVRSKNNVLVTRNLKVTVLELTKKLDAVPGEKVEVADLNNVSENEKNKIIAATKKANASFPPGTLYNVDQRGNLVITYPDKSTDKIDASYLVTPSNKPADTNKPAGQAPEITSDLSGKASTPADVTVKAEPGSTVKLYNNDGVVIGEAVANNQGVATISPTNSLPEGQITATATPAGGSESPKSTPITATRAEKPEVDGGVSRANDNTQLLVTRSHITVYPGEKVDVRVTAVASEMQKFEVKNPYAISGVKPHGGYLDYTRGSVVKRRDGDYSGTVAWEQPAGDSIVKFSVRNINGTVVTRDLKVTVLELTKKLDAVAGEKVEVADPNNVSEDEKNKIIAATTKANASFPPGTTYSVDEKGNLVITYPDQSTDKIAAAYLVTPAAKEADKYTPTAKAQTVAPGSTPDAKNSIANTGELPSGTTFAYKTPVDTATKGEKDAIVVVTYPDKSTDEVPVKVTVKDPRSDADKNDPKPKAQDIYKGSTPDAKGSIANAGDLPYGTSFAYKTPVDTETPGEKDATVVVTYPDGSKDEVPVKVTVEDPDKTSAENNTPTAKDQTVKVGEEPKAEASIGNFDKLPKGTKAEFKTPVDTTTPGEKDAIVVVTYPDSLTYEVPVKVTVKDPRSDADKNDPKAKAQDVNKGETPDAKGSIDNAGELPNGTTFAYKTPVDTETPGEKDATVVVTYPDKSTDEVPVKVTVKDPRSDADKNDPKAKAQDVNKGETPDAKGSIDNVGDLPSGTKFEYKTPVDTTTEGDKDAIVVVTYPDGSKDEVPVKVTVKDPRTDADKNTPVAKDQSVKPGETPNAKDSIGNVGELPEGTTFEFKTPVDTTTPGDKGTTVVVTYPDGSKDEVPVTVTVKDPDKTSDAEKNTPTAKDQTVKQGETPDAKNSIGNVGELPEGTTFEFKTPVDTTTPGDKGTTVVVTYPDGSKDEVPVKVTVKDSSALTQPEITADLTGKAGTKTPVEVTADPGTKVELFDKDGNKIGEGVTGEDGKASITPTVEIPAGPVTAKASKDGKTSDESAPKVATKDPAITPVVNPSALTDAEKAKVADEVKKANPTASKVEVGNDGTATVTFPDGSVAVLTPEKTVKEADSNGVKTPAITPVVNPSSLTDAEKAKVAEEVKKANPTAKDIKVNNDGSVVVTFADGSVAVLASENVVKEATKESPAQEPAKKAGAKELPNTGTKQSNSSLALALLAAVTGGLLIAKKREEEE